MNNDYYDTDETYFDDDPTPPQKPEKWFSRWDEETKPASSPPPEKYIGPLKYCIYKKQGAFQFSPIKAHSKGRKIGGVIIEGANYANGAYRWDQKIVFLLSPTEMAKVMNAFIRSQKLELFQDPGAGQSNRGSISKIMKISPGKDGSFFMNLTEKIKGSTNDKTANVSVQRGESIVLIELMRATIPKALGW